MNFLGFSYHDGYFQTWAVNSKIRRIPLVGPRLNLALKWICGKLTGHVPSKTEWGYGGGANADTWCRWCNQPGTLPLAQAGAQFEKMRTTVWNVTGCDIKQQEWSGPTDSSAPQGSE